MWTATTAAIETELADRTTGYRQAALAYLTLLLVDVARLATDVVADLRRCGLATSAATANARSSYQDAKRSRSRVA
jgi:hypothetical protein